MHLSRFDPRSDREILLSIERLLQKLIGEYEMDIFDRIIAAVTAIQAGDNSALSQHVAAIDAHLSTVDSEVLGLQSDDTSNKDRLTTIENGLAKIADAVNPPANPGGTDTSGSANTGSAPADGSQSSDVTPGSDNAPGASAPIPASGPGSETTGQVDTPTTSQ